MAFLKTWWMWMVIGVVVVALLCVRLLVTSGYKDEAAKDYNIAVNMQDKLNQIDLSDGSVPTEGDVEWARKMLEDVQKGDDTAADKLYKASSLLDKPHPHQDDFESEFTDFLHGKCEEMCAKFAENQAKLLGEYEEGVTPPSRCMSPTHQMADLTRTYATLKETIMPWRKYLIANHVHEIAGQVKVTLNNSFEQLEQTGENAKPEFRQKPQVRIIEEIGTFEFRPVKKATIFAEEEAAEDAEGGASGYGPGADDYAGMGGDPFGGGGMMDPFGDAGYGAGRGVSASEIPVKEEKTYHDVFPVSFVLVAHPKAIQDFMERMTDTSGGLIFLLRGVEYSRFSDLEVQPMARKDGQNASMGMGEGFGRGASAGRRPGMDDMAMGGAVPGAADDTGLGGLLGGDFGSKNAGGGGGGFGAGDRDGFTSGDNLAKAGTGQEQPPLELNLEQLPDRSNTADLKLNYDYTNEPPVMAQLLYDVIHFRVFSPEEIAKRKAREAGGVDGESEDTTTEGVGY